MALLGFVGAPAEATVIERVNFSDSESFTIEDCEFPLQGERTFRIQAHLRVDKGGQAFLQEAAISFREVITNPETGRWFVVRGHEQAHDIKATQVEGTVYEFVGIVAGPFVIEDSAGNVIVRDRGVIRETYLFDTLGDGTPGGVFLEVTNAVVHGPHPSLAADFSFCEIAAQLTGA